MRTPIALFTIGGLIMGVAIAYALIVGRFFHEAEILLPLPWFHVSMIDLYTGFLLFGGWILFREPSRAKAVGWIILILTLGNFAACFYALFAAIGARGDWQTFWMGSRRASTVIR